MHVMLLINKLILVIVGKSPWYKENKLSLLILLW